MRVAKNCPQVKRGSNPGLVTNVSNSIGLEQRTAFDLEDRPLWVTDANGVTVTNSYDSLGRLRTRTYPDQGVESFGYSPRGLIAYTNQIGLSNFFAYDEAGRKTSETNGNAEVIRYTNNPAGDLLSLTNGKNQTTKWGYNEYGLATNKVDQTNIVILTYKFDPNNRLTNRWSAGKGDTRYAYDAVGNLTNITYPVSPSVAYAYDPLNRLTNMVDATGTNKYSYTKGNQLWTEDGPFASDTVTNTYVNRLRTALSLQQPTGTWTNGFGYDAAKRLTNVTSPAGSFAYTLGGTGAGSPLVKRILLPNTSFITNNYDSFARLTSASLRNSGGSVLDSYLYALNPANQRTNLTRADLSTVAFQYDKIGQLTVADSSINTEDRGYFYDAAWNVNRRTNNGVTQTFSVNSQNELIRLQDPVNIATYDTNGNMVTSHIGKWIYVYDDENRLIQWAAYAINSGTPSDGDKLTDFVYDGMSRLRGRFEYHYVTPPSSPVIADAPPSSDWVLDSETDYIYDGKRVIQERNGSNLPMVSYTRGTDLSGSLEGAGGIGGLLGRSHGYSTGNWSTHNFYFADGNGNVTYMVNSSQTLAASYRYDPFGNTISSSGLLAGSNVYRLSSKEIHVNSGMYYYLYRFYDPNLQRWLTRDPLGEKGDVNLYRTVRNEPIGWVDDFGLGPYPTTRLDPKGNKWNPPRVPPFPPGGPVAPILPPQQPNPSTPAFDGPNALGGWPALANALIDDAAFNAFNNAALAACRKKPRSPDGKRTCCVLNRTGRRDTLALNGDISWISASAYVADKPCCQEKAANEKSGGLSPFYGHGTIHETEYIDW